MDTGVSIEQSLKILSERAESLIADLKCEITGVVMPDYGSELFKRVNFVYDRLSVARNESTPEQPWQHTDGDYLLEKLWELRSRILDFEQAQLR